MPSIEDAIELAIRAHRGQTDKGGQPYVLHALRMMSVMETDTERMVAVLHDVVEDSPWTLKMLQGLGYPVEVLEALDHLTRREGEPYEAFIERLRHSPIARRVKSADLRDNLDVRRLGRVAGEDTDRLNRYLAALTTISET